jgi:glycosyltransferase involved in cell wall biosynthesis
LSTLDNFKIVSDLLLKGVGGRSYRLPHFLSIMKLTKKEPLVSVIMPVYNGGFFMGQAIESILKQTYKNFEILIIDDASTDNTWQIMKNYKKLFPKKIKIFRLKKNIGAFGAMNLVIKKAKGEFIAPMDSDDLSHRQRLEKQVDFLQENPEVIVLGTQAWVIDENNEVIGKKNYPCNNKEIYQNYAVVHPIVHPSCMIRRSLLPEKNKIYENKYGVNDDYYTFFKLLNYGKFANLPDYLLSYRIHGANSSLQNLKGKFFNISKIRIMACRELNYRFSLKAIIIFLAQFLLVMLIPGKIINYVYFFLRGMYEPAKFLEKINLLGFWEKSGLLLRAYVRSIKLAK